MSTNTFLPQKIQSGFEACAHYLQDEKVRVPILARLVREMILTPENWKDANELAIKQFLAQEAENKRLAEEGQKRQKQLDQPDSRYYILYNRRNSDPISLDSWFKRIPVEAHKEYLQQLKARPYHYRSLFTDGDIADAIQWYEIAIAKREAEEAKPTAKPKLAYST